MNETCGVACNMCLFSSVFSLSVLVTIYSSIFRY